MKIREILSRTLLFDWDKWNIEKNLLKHKVTWQECEQVFFNKPIVEAIPLIRKEQEQRFYALGITDKQRKLTIIFTLRKNKLRVISARDMSRKERRAYDEKIEKGS